MYFKKYGIEGNSAQVTIFGSGVQGCSGKEVARYF
jgi:hypothetical protein